MPVSGRKSQHQPVAVLQGLADLCKTTIGCRAGGQIDVIEADLPGNRPLDHQPDLAGRGVRERPVKRASPLTGRARGAGVAAGPIGGSPDPHPPLNR